MGDERYLIDVLCELSGYSRRTIRYYIQSGLLDPPAGRGRGGFYSEGHVERLRAIRRLQEAGLTLESIRVALSGRAAPAPGSQAGDVPAPPAPVRAAWGRYEIAPGVELHASREAEERHGERIAQIVRFARQAMREGEDEWNDRSD